MNAVQAATANYVVMGTTPFSDVPGTDSFAKYVEAIHNNGITTGCGNSDYCPSQYVTRAQAAAFLVRATQVQAGLSPESFTCNGGVTGESLPCASTTPYFSDVPATDSFFPYVQKLKELEITTGCGNGDYCPSEVVGYYCPTPRKGKISLRVLRLRPIWGFLHKRTKRYISKNRCSWAI